MSRTPEPRPALRRAEDGAVHPAAPRATPEKHLHPAPGAPAVAPPAPEVGHFKPGDLRARKAVKPVKDKAGKGKGVEETVPLEVRIPKKLRKSLRKRANAEDVTADDIVIEALSAWLDS